MWNFNKNSSISADISGNVPSVRREAEAAEDSEVQLFGIQPEIEEEYLNDDEEGIYDVQKDFLAKYSINPDKVKNMSIDENNYVYIDYKDENSEVYYLNDEDKLILRISTQPVKGGSRMKLYSSSGSYVKEERIVDEENSRAEVIKYSSSGVIKAVHKYNLKGARGENIYDALISGSICSARPDEELIYDAEGALKLKIESKIDETGALKSLKQYDAENRLINARNNFEMDDITSAAYQGDKNDCWLLAAINSLAGSSAGQRILRENITFPSPDDEPKIYAVRLPGAEKALDSLKSILPEDKIFIKGAYSVSQEELDAANLSFEYSTGDQNVLLYELVFEKYRADVNQTLAANHISKYTSENAAGLKGSLNEDTPLDGGSGYEALFLLTGIKPQVWFNIDNQETVSGIKIDSISRKSEAVFNIDNKNQNKARADLLKKLKNTKHTTVSGFMKTADLNTSSEYKDMLIQKLIEASKNGSLDKYAASAGLYVSYGGSTFTSHAVSIVKMTEKEAVFTDPNDKLPDGRFYSMPAEDFKKCIYRLDTAALE